MSTSVASLPLARSAGKRRRISVAAILALSFGSLLLLSVGGVLALSVGANYRNTVDLLRAQANLLVDAMGDSLNRHMAPSASAVDGLARLYAEGRFDVDDSDTMMAALSGALAAVPEAAGMLIYTEGSIEHGVVRDDKTGSIIPLEPRRETAPEAIRELDKQYRVDGVHWGAFVANEFGLYANVSAPLVRNGKRAGVVIAPVELQTLSKLTQDLSARFNTTAFLLDGDDRIIAHERLAGTNAKASGIAPLMPLDKINDLVLAQYAKRQMLGNAAASAKDGLEVSEIRLGSEQDVMPWDEEPSFIVLTRQIPGFSEKPWRIGAYFDSSQLSAELQRASNSAMLGLAGLAAALIAAVLLGRRLARPVQAIAGQAQRVANFELDDLPPLPHSRVRELDDQASAFNAMLIGLRAFSTYIPRSLVAKLVRSGESGVAEPREALVTVMFTDIAGFTTLSEHMDAATVTRLLNHHFEILCAAVDAHGGTVDKFLGDGMMAFFGAPDRLKGHAAAAVRAAARIREDLNADADVADTEGRPRLKVRIGIQTGPVTVGNIGGSDRVNYTIVGDTVNVSQRLQGLGKELAPDAETAIVVSDETASQLNERFETLPAGRHSLHGRGEAMEVFLIGDVDMASFDEARSPTASAA